MIDGIANTLALIHASRLNKIFPIDIHIHIHVHSHSMHHYIFCVLLVVENTKMEKTVAVNGNVVLNCCYISGIALIRYGANVGPTTGRVALLRQVSQERLGSVTSTCQIAKCKKRSRLVKRPYLTLLPKLRFQSTTTLA
jgi:hypothetical protein